MAVEALFANTLQPVRLDNIFNFYCAIYSGARVIEGVQVKTHVGTCSVGMCTYEDIAARKRCDMPGRHR